MATLFSDKKRIVYWIGAGASARALPVVADMPAALRASYEWLANGYEAMLTRFDFARYTTAMDRLAEKSRTYGTIDTYARSLFLLNRTKELAELKLHLAMYFILEQAVQTRPYIGARYNVANYTRSERIDTRYMGWLALLLDENLRPPENVRVISWNYDLQVEHALAVYRGENHLSNVHGPQALSYPGTQKDKDLIATRPFVLHLNGVAGLADHKDGRLCLHHSLADVDPSIVINRLFELHKDYDRREEWMLWAMNKTFTFAWEGTTTARLGLEMAKQYLTESDIVVIVGYSFPSFNRSIDQNLVDIIRSSSTDNKPKYVVIQNPSMTAEDFRDTFRWAAGAGFPGVVHVSDTTSFHIPPELF